MRFNNKLFYSFLGLTSIVICIILFYINDKYSYLESPISAIHITYTNHVQPQGLPTMYVFGRTESKLNYRRAYKFKPINDTLFSTKLDDTLKLRAFRFYFEYPEEKIEIKNIDLLSATKTYSIDLNQKFNSADLKWTKENAKFGFEVMESNGYFDSPKHFLYPSDFKDLYKLYIPIFLVIFILTSLVYNLNRIYLKTIDIPGISLAILVFTEFLPAPTYNVALILGVVLNIRAINLKKITQRKINLIFIAFFTIHLFSNLFLTDKGYTTMGKIERFLPFLILTVLIPSIANRKYLLLFPVSAIVIGIGLLITSIFDVFVHDNITFLSFDNFSKYLHPVYYSYLLFFSIVYMQFYYFGKLKYVIFFILFSFLVFSGSKMVLIFSLLAVFFNFIKQLKTLWFAIPFALIILLFSPLKNRFQNILNKNDLSILQEENIVDVNDSRINGLTFRLILWREALATMHGVDYIIGKGITKQTNKLLESRITDLGLLKHKNFNPHNQYVDTFWRTGIIGLLLLILIPIYSLVFGIKRKDKLLIIFSIFLIAVMCSESIFGRVRGVYFFTTVLLILTNSNFNYKIKENH